MKIITYERLMRLGQRSGCHQMPERSFNINGRQFPVCARCTGVLIGNVIAYAMFFIYVMPIWICFIGCFIMLIDWLIQRLSIRESTNIRRLITGIIGGYALSTIYCTVIKYIAICLIICKFK